MPLSNKAAFFMNAVQNRPSWQPFLWLACPCELCMHRVHGFACNPENSKWLQPLSILAFRGFSSCIKTSELSQQRAGGENCARRGEKIKLCFVDCCHTPLIMHILLSKLTQLQVSVKSLAYLP